MKRVVTAEDSGKSFFLDTTELESMDPVVVQNMAIWMLWGFDEIPSLPFAGPGGDHSGGFYGAPGQVRIFMIRFGPDATPEVVSGGDDQLSELIADDGNHATDTIDVDFLVKGELGIEMQNGEIRWLSPGDVVVQNGVVHKWHNRSGEDAYLGAITIGAVRNTRP